jgi:hypothetical protein
VCYSRGIALDVGLDVSFDNMPDCKGIREKAREVNSTEAYITNGENSRCFPTGVTLVMFTNQTGARHSSLLHRAAHSASYPLRTGALSQEVQRPGLKTTFHLPLVPC